MSARSGARVAIVGSGVAGLAAAHAAFERGAHVTLIGRGAGATSLFSGAIDDVDWSEREAAADLLAHALTAGPLDTASRAFVESLGGWELPGEGKPLPRLASTAGIVRTARGRDRSLLDLGSIAGRTLLLPRAPRAGWDADALVRSLRDEQPTGVSLQVVEAPVLRYADESRVSDADLASRHDEDARVAWLAARLAPFVERAGKERAAVLFGPWLGVKRERASALAAILGCPAGEALHAGSCVPGLRFEVARQAWLERAGVEVVTARASRIARKKGAQLVVEIEGRDAWPCDSVVVATGGLVGGGIVYDPPEHRSGPDGPERMRSAYRSAVQIEGARVAAASAIGPASSAFGPVLEGAAWPSFGSPGTLERAGLVVDETAACAPGVFAAGDVVYAEPRTILSAIRSALRAGAGAASFALSLDPSTLAAAQ